MLSGSNYIVSVIAVLQSEKKFKLNGLLKLYSASKGIIKIKDFFLELTQYQRVIMTRNLWWTFFMKM